MRKLTNEEKNMEQLFHVNQNKFKVNRSINYVYFRRNN